MSSLTPDRGAPKIVDLEVKDARVIFTAAWEGLEEMRRWLDGFWDSALESYAEAVRAAVTEEENP